MSKKSCRNCVRIVLPLLACASLVAVVHQQYRSGNGKSSLESISRKKKKLLLDSKNNHTDRTDNRSRTHGNDLLSFERKWKNSSQDTAIVGRSQTDTANNLSPFERKWNSPLFDDDPAAWDRWLGRCCGGYVNTHSGCKIARWYYSVGDEVKSHSARVDLGDCDSMPDRRNLTAHLDDIRENDTVYVTLVTLRHFVDRALDRIPVDFVLIAGQDHLVPPVGDETIDRILESERVIRFFCHNLEMYGGRNKRHPKLRPFPYGMKGRREDARAQLPYYSLGEHMENSRNKSGGVLVYAGPLTKTNGARKHIPQEAERLPFGEFLTRMGNARYVLSPDGDRPDCHRHYEAILVGTVPVTQMDPFLYRHLAGAPVVFANREWNLTTLASGLDPKPAVNRNLVLEEYWMDWADREAGVELNWADDLDSGERGFRDGPFGSWAPIGDARGDWVSVSDAMVCVRHSYVSGVAFEGKEGTTRHVACCSSSRNATEASANPRLNATKEEMTMERRGPKWFNRKSGWNGTTYDEAVTFCSTAHLELCPFDTYCPGGSAKLSTAGHD